MTIGRRLAVVVRTAAVVGLALALGVQRLVGVNACGSLREDFAPGEIVIPDQLVDWTRKRANTFFGEGLVALSDDGWVVGSNQLAREWLNLPTVGGGTLADLTGLRVAQMPPGRTLRLQTSRIGRAWVAIREDEMAAESMGLDTRNLKLLSCFIAAIPAGMAGVMFGALFLRYGLETAVIAHASLDILMHVILPEAMAGSRKKLEPQAA